MRKPGYKESSKETLNNNTRLRKLAAERKNAEDLAAPPVAKKAVGRPPKGKGSGFDQATVQAVGGGFNKSTLPYGARMMIERYDNEKRLRKNV